MTPPPELKKITDFFIALPLIGFVLWGLFDVWGLCKWGQSFIPYTISARIHEINNSSGGGIGALICLLMGLLLSHLFIR